MRPLCLLVCLFASWCLHLAPAAAQEVPPNAAVSAQRQTGGPPAIVLARLQPGAALPISVREHTPSGMTLEQVLAESPRRFTQFQTIKPYALDPQHVLWLHLRVQADASNGHSGWILGLPKAFVNRVDWYYRDPQGAWRVQSAGLWTPHTQWSLHGLYPQFQLPGMAAGEHDFYLRVQHNLPMHFALRLWSSDMAHQHMQNEFLVVGLVLGLMALMALVTCVYSVVYRDSTYAWYALFVLFGIATCASFVGLAHYLLWPAATAWAEVATAVFLMGSMAAQLQFCRALFMAAGSPSMRHRVVSALIALSLLAMGLLVVLPDVDVRVALFSVQVLVCALAQLLIVLSALRRRALVGCLWLLAYAPLMLVVTLTVLGDMGLAALPWLPTKAPLYALTLEMLVLLVALHLHAKSGHAQEVRDTTLAATDPLTGFVPPALFMVEFEQLWQQARREKGDLAVAYVDILQLEHDKTPSAHQDTRALTARCVRLLRTVAREQDTVARIDGNLFALLMPGLSEGEGLTAILARLVALSRMGEEHAHSVPVRLRIAASTLGRYQGSLKKMDRDLRKLLNDPAQGTRRPIRFVERRTSVPDSQAMNDLWDRALAEALGRESARPVPTVH